MHKTYSYLKGFLLSVFTNSGNEEEIYYKMTIGDGFGFDDECGRRSAIFHCCGDGYNNNYYWGESLELKLDMFTIEKK